MRKLNLGFVVILAAEGLGEHSKAAINEHLKTGHPEVVAEGR